ncbi:MAG: hypothetical protein WC028_31410 [Candidatus Obscuribacterales bacterium]
MHNQQSNRQWSEFSDIAQIVDTDIEIEVKLGFSTLNLVLRVYQLTTGKAAKGLNFALSANFIATYNLMTLPQLLASRPGEVVSFPL